MSGAAAAADAGAVIRAGSASFALASRLLPPETRNNVWLLYAWCRHCDDVTDGQTLGRPPVTAGAGANAVDHLRALTMAAIEGSTRLPEPFAGLSRVVAATGLPPSYLLDHVRGFELDAAGYRCATLDDTLTYCYHVAGAVGLMMAWIMGVREDETLLRGRDLGMAFQLTNIARDVDQDALVGRVYLPSDWLEQTGIRIDGAQDLDPETRRLLVPVVTRLLDEADRYYTSAQRGIAKLPARAAWAIATAKHVYRDIGLEVRRRGARAWDERVATSSQRKWRRVLQAMGETAWSRL
jgi:phytoene synthase